MKNYFKKFSIMLFYIFLLLCTMGISNANKAFAEEYLITPTNMTDNSSPSPYKASSSSVYYRYAGDQPWKAFNGTSDNWLDAWFSDADKTSNEWLAIDIGAAKVASSYSFAGWNDTTMAPMPKDWTFEGSNDGINWIVLDKRTNITDWNAKQEKNFTIENNIKAYSNYRINVLQNNGYSYIAIDNFKIYSDSELTLPDKIFLNKSTDILEVGKSDNLIATTTSSAVSVTWNSSDTSIATVDSTGKVTAIKEGNAVITATTADGLTATCAVAVTPKTAEPTNPDPDSTDSEKIVNIAHAKGDNTNNAGGDVTIIFHGSADTTLSVVKTADVKEVWVGDNFTYTIVVTNTGTKTAKAVVVNDPAPNHIDFVVNGVTTTQGTVDPSSTSKNIIVNVGDIAPGATVTIKVPATVIA